jgi:RNA-directed DNA polymerase
MNKRLTPYDQICDPESLWAAYRQVRKNSHAPGIDRVTCTEYERDLPANLDDLAARLREQRYRPMPLRTFEMKKASGGMRKLSILTIEDRIVQRAILNVLQPLWESAFLPCSHGFRPQRSPATAVKQVLDYRAAGDVYVFDADIKDCFDSLDHNLLMQFIAQRVRDKRLLNLLWALLDTGQVLPQTEAAAGTIYDRVTTYVANSVDGAVTNLLHERGFGGYRYDYRDEELYPQENAEPEDLHQAARKEAIKRLGTDAVLLGLTYAARLRNLVSPTTLALTGAMVVASAAYPYAARKLRERNRPRSIGAVQGGALSPLFSNIYLHELDVAVTKAGFHLVRFADDFVITTRDEASARAAQELTAHKLQDLRLALHPQKTRITRFEEGLEFLGYRFAPFQCTAEPIAEKNSLPALKAVAEVRDKLAPVANQAAQQAKQGVTKLKSLLKRKREDAG